jgi:hypothetical protein
MEKRPLFLSSLLRYAQDKLPAHRERKKTYVISSLPITFMGFLAVYFI